MKFNKKGKRHKLFHNLKSQLTIFIVLGIMVLGIFAFLFKLSSTVTEEDIEKNINLVYQDFLGKSALRDYVEDCLDVAAKEGLILVGLQGGKIYSTQIEGTSPFGGQPGKDYLPFNFLAYGRAYSLNMTYGIKKPKFFSPMCTYHCAPDGYPYEGSLVVMPDSGVENAFGLTGTADTQIEPRNSLPPLCNAYGSNWYNLSGAAKSCEIYDPNGIFTTQTFLMKFVTNRTQECMNFSYFTQRNYNISFSGIKSDVLIGENDVVFAINYSLNVSLKGNVPVTRYSVFSSKQNIKLKKIYELAYHMIVEDVKNIFFDIDDIIDLNSYLRNSCSNFSMGTREGGKAPCFDERIFNISIFRNVCTDCTIGNYSDVIRIEDNSSIIRGQPYIFQFAVENRIPALDKIDESVDENYDYFHYLNNTFNITPTQAYGTTSPTFNIKVNVGEKINVYPRAIDPDDETVTYLIQEGQFCCDFELANGNFSHTGLPGSEYNLILYACDKEGLENCKVDSCSKDCASTVHGACDKCDYQNISIKVG